MGTVTRRTIAAILLLEEDEEGEHLVVFHGCENRSEISNIYKSRAQEGAYNIFIERHLNNIEIHFKAYLRISRDLFNYILNAIEGDIPTNPLYRYPKPIEPAVKLCLTLRFLATGETYRSLANQFRIHFTWLSRKIIPETLSAICKNLQKVAFPDLTEDFLKKIAAGFERRWSYPHCIGSIDGKHIRVRCPQNTGSMFFNYKEFFSVSLLALVDYKYKFLAVDVGSFGKEGDAGIFTKSQIGKIVNQARNFPRPDAVSGTDTILPYIVLGDEAFKLTTNLMRPYSQEQAKLDVTKRIYNYRHCRARRTVENSFGLLSQVFRIFYTPIAVQPEIIDKIILTACIIHNFLGEENPTLGTDETVESTPNLSLPTNFRNLGVTLGRTGNFEAYGVRERFRDFFSSPEGTVPWQDTFVERVQ